MIRQDSEDIILCDLGVLRWEDFYREYSDNVSTASDQILTT